MWASCMDFIYYSTQNEWKKNFTSPKSILSQINNLVGLTVKEAVYSD